MRFQKSAEFSWMVCQAKPLLKLYALSLFCITTGSILTLLDPLIMKWLIDVVLPKKDGRLLLIGASGFAIVYLGRLALVYCGSLISFVAVQKMVFRARLKLIRQLHQRSAEYHENTPVGEILYRVEQDVSRVGDLGGDILPTLSRMLLVSVMVLTTMCILNLRLTLLVVPLLPVFYLLQRKYRAQLICAADDSQRRSGRMSSILQEHLSGIVQLQLLNRHGTHARKYAVDSAQGAVAQVKQRMAEIRFSAAYMSVIALGSTMILGYGGYEVTHDGLTVGGLVAFYSYVTRLFEPLAIAVDLQSRIQRVAASIRRILEIQDTARDRSVPGKHRLHRDISPTLEFRAARFRRRDGRVVLRDVTFRAEAGEKIALVGPSGCGKSTIAHLAAGLYDPISGAILLGGEKIQTINRRNLRSIVSLVPQDPILFSLTLRETLQYGNPNATYQEIEQVVSLAQLESVVRAMPRGLDEPLGPMGHGLSGGEKKRLALARAMLRRPKILILDEVTSGLDAPTTACLLRGLDEFRTGMTVILISHKPGTIAWAERIIVMNAGRIVDQGDHLTLARNCLVYQALRREENIGNADGILDTSSPQKELSL